MINNNNNKKSHQQMQKHQQWLENRSYEHHLDCIQKIKSRKNRDMTFSASYKHKTKRSSPQSKHLNATEKQNIYVSKQNRVSTLQFEKQDEIQNGHLQHQSLNNQFYKTQHEKNKNSDFKQKNSNEQPTIKQFICSKNSKPSTATKLRPINPNNHHSSSKSQLLHNIPNRVADNKSHNISLQEQELLWNNFLLGKRILETSPVISKKKHDYEYKKHKQLLRSRTCRKPARDSSGFRSRKLQQHNQVIERLADDHRIQNHLNQRLMFTIVIERIQILKFKLSSFQNIMLSLKYAPKTDRENSKIKKQTKQVSECIPSGLLTNYHFFFNIKKRILQDNRPVIIEIKNVKSLNVLSIGTFSFQFGQFRNIESQEAKLFNFGKLIGTVTFSANLGRKQEFMSNL